MSLASIEDDDDEVSSLLDCFTFLILIIGFADELLFGWGGILYLTRGESSSSVINGVAV
jgi:hypothetical protein